MNLDVGIDADKNFLNTLFVILFILFFNFYINGVINFGKNKKKIDKNYKENKQKYIKFSLIANKNNDYI